MMWIGNCSREGCNWSCRLEPVPSGFFEVDGRTWYRYPTGEVLCHEHRPGRSLDGLHLKTREDIDAEIVAANAPTMIKVTSASGMELPGERKATPIFSGVMAYFPDALAEVARLSKAGNDKHNPGEEMHHARSKSMDHADCIARHLLNYDEVDEEDGFYHAVKVAWRSLALLQELLEERRGLPMARGARH